MPLQSSVRALKKPRLDDEVRFLRSWIEKPLHMGAVMPSGRLLARTMAQYVDADDTGPVIELGPGTGAITSALIDRGVDQLAAAERRLAADMLATGQSGQQAVETWLAAHPEATRIRRSVEEIAGSGLTLAKLTVAANLLADLVKA